MPLNDVMKEMELYYAERAPWYDASMRYDQDSAHERLAPLIDQVRRFAEGQDILEIACGPGFWTQIIASAARSVVAVDLNIETLAEARKKEFSKNNVKFLTANAYDLSKVPGRFTAGFHNDWFSHVPHSKVSEFLSSFHSRLGSGARVLMIDSTKNEYSNANFNRVDEDGNIIQRRPLMDPRTKVLHGHRDIIKNFPKESELRTLLADSADNVNYCEVLNRWMLTYAVR
jgi:ubiquinone/menaquinone biosynthesis C-methylase UbiE